MRKLFTIFTTSIVLAANLFAVSAIADDTQDLANLLKDYKTAQGNFEQTLVDAKGELIQESSGIFTVKSPGYFRWETQQPFPQLLVSNLSKVWLYDPDLEQVTIRPYTQSIEQSPALLLSGNVGKITENYDVQQLSTENSRFTLIPKQPGGTFTQLELIFVDEVLTSMLIRDSLEQTTTFTFGNFEINQPIVDKFFQFEPPEGVDILINES